MIDLIDLFNLTLVVEKKNLPPFVSAIHSKITLFKTVWKIGEEEGGEVTC